MPSTSSDANASDSAWPQSIPPSVDRGAPALELLRELRVHRELLGRAQERLGQLRQCLGADRRHRVGGRRARDRAVVLDLRLGGIAERRLQPVVRGAQHRLDLGDEGLGLLPRQHALLDQLLLVELAHARVRVDLLDHQRLRVRGLVLLVVAEAAVADEIDHDVVAEAAAVGHRQAHGRDRRLGVVGVDVDDRHVEALGEVGRVARRAALGRIGREPDLVVGDQVQRAAGRVALEVVQVERLGDDALPGERGVAVQQHGERDRRVVRAVARSSGRSARHARALRQRGRPPRDGSGWRRGARRLCRSRSCASRARRGGT